MQLIRFAALALCLCAPAASFAQELPEYQLNFHGNVHDGCSGIGSNDFVICGGPFLTADPDLDTAPAARFDFNALSGAAAQSPYDANWTWTPTSPTTISGSTVVIFWASCNAGCAGLGGGEWEVTVWKNDAQVAPAPTADPEDVDPTFVIVDTPPTPDVPARLKGSFVLAAPIELNGTTDTLTLRIENRFIDAGPGSRIYYDSQSACPGAAEGEPCDSKVVFNARDSDSDGVPDVLDECPGTPEGVSVDGAGCPQAGSCTAGAGIAAAAAVPPNGPVMIDPAVLGEWRALPPTATYGAFVHFYRQGTRLQQDALLQTTGLTKLHDFRRYTTAVFVEGPVAAFQQLTRHPWVMRIEHNAPLRYLDATQSWTTRVRIAQEEVSGGPYYDAAGDVLTGKGVTLGVIDSGLFGAHPDFAGRIAHNFKLISPVGGPVYYQDVSYGDSENGGGGHGTHVTGIASGDGTQSDGGYPDAAVAPFLPGTFTSASPQSSIVHWGNGAALFVLNVNLAYQHLLDNIATPGLVGLRAVNNSYGDGGGSQYNAGDAGKQMIKQIVGCNVNMVFAAGNDGGDGTTDNTSSYCKDPTPGVICVASYNDQGTGALDAPLSSFSSRGKQGTPTDYPDIAAPGDLSTSTCAQATPTQAICTGGDDSAAETEWQPWYGTISGTSMASPNITGVLGVIAQANPALDAPERERLLQRTARKVGGGYEADPQYDGSTIHFGYGAGLVDIQKALDDMNIPRKGLPAQDEERVIFDADGDVDVAEGAADAVKLTMQNVNLNGPGVMYRLTVGDAADFVSPALSYRLEQNVRGVPARTTIRATADEVTVAEPSLTNTALATFVERVDNVISFFVPYSQLGYPPINEPIHNIRVVVSNDAGALDYAPSPLASTAQTAVAQPMFGRAFTTRLAPGTIPPSSERACELPGLTRVISGPGTTGDSSQTGMDDLRRIWVAEPGDMPGKVVITMKVDNLNPAPIANYRWYVYFNTPARTDVEAQLVAMDTVAPGSSAAPRFIRGFRSTIDNPAAPVGSFTVEGDLPGSGFNVDGTITLVLDKAQFNLATGDAITGIAGSIRQTSNPQNGAGLTVDSASALEPYVLVGNLPCPVIPIPVAALVADVISGEVPLTVAFDGSGSTAGSAETSIASYTFDFGDGSAPVTQAEPTIEYTYDTAGDYTATLTVTDNLGTVSSNIAEQVIEVAGIDLAPIANAGPNVSGSAGTTVTLDGSGSSDPEGATLSYTWQQLSGPPVTLSPNANAAQVSFVIPDTDVPMSFMLTVSDGTQSDTDDVLVTVVPVAGPESLQIGNNAVGGVPPASLLLLALMGLARRRRR